MSAAASPAASEPGTKRGEVTYRFCPECSNLLYPKEDRETNELQFVCKACTAVSKTEPACTYRHHLGSTVTETAGVTTDVANDPTVGDIFPATCCCTMCGEALRCRECGASAVEGEASEDEASDDVADSASSL